MSQHDFNIANQSFPATRTDINDAILAIVSNSSGDTEPSTTYANQWWYETDTNILKIRNEANDGWVDVITLDASMTASASELHQLDAITRGSILYGNASGETARLAAGGAATVLTSDGTDISWAAAAAGGGGGMEFIASSGALSAVADVAFTQFDSSKYDSYEFNLLNVKPSTDDINLVAEASTDGGSSYDGSTVGNYHDAPATNRANFAVTPDATGVGNDTNEYGASGRFLINNPAISGYTYTQFLGMFMDAIGNLKTSTIDQNCASVYLNTAEVNAIKFKFTSGNIASGEIVMFGIKNS